MHPKPTLTALAGPDFEFNLQRAARRAPSRPFMAAAIDSGPIIADDQVAGKHHSPGPLCSTGPTPAADVSFIAGKFPAPRPRRIFSRIFRHGKIEAVKKKYSVL